MRIAFFDSGIGGLTVLHQAKKRMPREDYLYYADTDHVPYGKKTKEEIRQYVQEAVDFIATQDVKALVVACNTATAAAIKLLRKKYPDLIVVGIEPALKLAADSFPGGRLGVLATEVTLREEKFDELMHRFDEQCTVYKIPAPGVANLIEAGKNDSPEMIALLRSLLDPYVGKLDALVLGCTHYPFVTRNIAAIMGPGTVLLHGGKGTARETKRRLAQRDLLREGSGSVTILNSADDPNMIRLSRALLEGGKLSFEE